MFIDLYFRLYETNVLLSALYEGTHWILHKEMKLNSGAKSRKTH